MRHTSHHGDWQVHVPVDTAEDYGLHRLAPAPELGQQLDPPATGWRVGLILLIPTFALTPTVPPAGAPTTRLPAAERGRCTQITVLLGDPFAANVVATASQKADSLVAQGGAVQLWRGQTVLPPDLTRHLIRTRQHLVDAATHAPRQHPAFTCFRTADGVDVLTDLGPI